MYVLFIYVFTRMFVYIIHIYIRNYSNGFIVRKKEIENAHCLITVGYIYTTIQVSKED
jgi:hypothetical protein